MSNTADRVYNVLFLCTGNSARSLIAEALLNHLGKSRFVAFSAGSYPTGHVHPLAVTMVEEMELPCADMRSKSWQEFAGPGAPKLDFVFTVCDAAGREVCPQWPGQPMSAHWGIDDPATRAGSYESRRRRFEQATLQLKRRIEIFLNLPLESIDSLALQHHLDEIGRLP